MSYEEDIIEVQKTQRRQRDVLLSETDWIVVKALEAGEDVPSDIATYRQALRDITNDPRWDKGMPTWPEKPAGY